MRAASLCWQGFVGWLPCRLPLFTQTYGVNRNRAQNVVDGVKPSGHALQAAAKLSGEQLGLTGRRSQLAIAAAAVRGRGRRPSLLENSLQSA